MSSLTKIELLDAEFFLVQKLIYQQVGIQLDDSKRSLVKNRLTKRLLHYGVQKFSDYLRIVQLNSDEAAEMINQITTNETYFFREQTHFEFLHKVAEASTMQKDFRVWSAAASFGAEAYSIAMVLETLMPSYEVVATDINT